jgi:hypothetical protein
LLVLVIILLAVAVVEYLQPLQLFLRELVVLVV